MGQPGWPARLNEGSVGIRPMRLRDAVAWSEVRLRNEAWLAPWEATSPAPWSARHSVGAFAPMLRGLRRQARAGASMPFAITVDHELAGMVTVGNIVRGAFNSGYVGYWVDERVSGRGVMTTALALAVDHCFGPARLHRIEANVRPENVASRRVVEKLGFTEEAYHRRFLDIDGAYRDHVGYAVLAEDVPEGMLDRLRRR